MLIETKAAENRCTKTTSKFCHHVSNSKKFSQEKLENDNLQKGLTLTSHLFKQKTIIKMVYLELYLEVYLNLIKDQIFLTLS